MSKNMGHEEGLERAKWTQAGKSNNVTAWSDAP
ncbi:MAG: hypothetical protein SLRJCFUN_000229 [Candidatus Fervidibacter sp.]